jgi:LPXTG-motif cell wall-anchored protein
MNFKKIVAAVAAAALALSTFAFSASAADPLTFPIQVVGNSGAAVPQDVTINGNGTYTVEFTDLADAPYQQFNTPAPTGGEVVAPGYENAQITLDSILINGEIEVSAGKSFPLYGTYDTGTDLVVNFNFFNVWYEAGNLIDSANVEKYGNAYNFLDADGNPVTVTSMKATFTISGVTEDAAEVADAAPEDAAAPATTAPATGNMPVALIGGVAVLALAGVVVSRKRK